MNEVKQEIEGPEAAYVQSDLYADVMQPPQEVDVVKPPNPINQNTGQPYVQNNGVRVMEYKSYTTIHPKSVEQQEKESKIAQSVESQPRGKQFYVGNLTWWTTDEEVTNAIIECGVNDFISIKFFENRINGQSKGFALVEVASETSQRLCMERLPNQVLHNQKPIVTFVNKQSLTMFENQARKATTPQNGQTHTVQRLLPTNRMSVFDHFAELTLQGLMSQDMPGLAQEDSRKPYRENKSKSVMPQGPHFIQGFPPPGANVVSAPVIEHNLLQHQALPLPPTGIPPGSIIVDAMGNVIQGGVPGVVPGPIPPQPNSVGGPMQPLPPRPGVAPHINPAFIPQEAAPPVDPVTGVPLQTAGLNEQDMESMRRNQAVASTAIQRAMTDANRGEFESGIETLVTAISLIKQSTTANTEPAQVLVQSLQDCLQGLEGQLVQKGSGGHHRNRYSSRDYRDEREHRRRRERSRSPSRGHERRRSYSPHRSRSRDRRDRSRR